jgi:hypothetical protein
MHGSGGGAQQSRCHSGLSCLGASWADGRVGEGRLGAEQQ